MNKVTFKDYEQLTNLSTGSETFNKVKSLTIPVNTVNNTKRAKELILLTERLTELGVNGLYNQLLLNYWHYNT